MRELVVGGVRSGKSRHGEARARSAGGRVTYIATATAGDAEMAARIAMHRQQRPDAWHLVEEPLALGEVLAQRAGESEVLLVDCLALWVSNLLHAGEAQWMDERARLLEVLPVLPGRIILISNEVGMGIVPANALARRFADELGWLNQAVAALCERVTMMAAGLPLVVKSEASGL
ncbi:MAG: bifunctional adenosylcobinamide kinase/adenosylcobinamide-phosphate guanylyltransferase [Pseudomonadota bacterium]|nr:bifunctional adenosylcobinamide kinase/adenosylcobinamide-phosphate guanylyltransferase [Pseudomonadota bacterium]